MTVKDPRSIMYIKRPLYPEEEGLISAMFDEMCDYDSDTIGTILKEIQKKKKAAAKRVLAFSFKAPFLLLFGSFKDEWKEIKPHYEFLKKDTRKLSEELYAVYMRFEDYR